ncbi:MAG TPA: ABC transporter ATP-binding protein [Lachnospiraceae bacterium]|nr:ABC transporter ATP-binding protein [Lachnospiraceae bacterium]
MSSCVLQVNRVCKSFGKNEILRDIDLSIGKCEVYGLIGQNGAGKTTLLRVISGLMKPTNGTVSIKVPIIGYMPQSCRFDDGNTVRETICMFAKLRNSESKESIILCERLHLDPTKKVRHLSPGQQKKMQIILAMIGNPEFYILDEPTAGLDPSATYEMKSMIKELHIMGKSILISSHILQDMDEICTNIAILEKGRLTYNHELTNYYIVKTSPIAKDVLQTLTANHSIYANEDGTTITVQMEKEQVPEFIEKLSGMHIKIYEVTVSNMKNLVKEKLHIGEEVQHP